MLSQKLKNLRLVFIAALVLVGIPYLLVRIGSFVQFDYDGYISSWWLVLIYELLLVSTFIIKGIDLEKYLNLFFGLFIIVPFVLLGIQIGEKPTVDQKLYRQLTQLEEELDAMDDERLSLQIELNEIQSEGHQQVLDELANRKNHEIVFFTTGSSQLTSDSKERIEDFIQSIDNSMLNVHGYADSMGSDSSNVSLSFRRASSVSEYMKTLDMRNNSILAVKGFGSDYPLDQYSAQSANSINRRVSIEIVGKSTPNTTIDDSNVRSKITQLNEDRQALILEIEALRKTVNEGV